MTPGSYDDARFVYVSALTYVLSLAESFRLGIPLR